MNRNLPCKRKPGLSLIDFALPVLCALVVLGVIFTVLPKPARHRQTSPGGEDCARDVLDAFKDIQPGMTYSEVVSVLGSEGTVLSRSVADGAVTTVYYWCICDGEVNLNVTFSRGRVIAKSYTETD